MGCSMCRAPPALLPSLMDGCPPRRQETCQAHCTCPIPGRNAKAGPIPGRNARQGGSGWCSSPPGCAASGCCSLWQPSPSLWLPWSPIPTVMHMEGGPPSARVTPKAGANPSPTLGLRAAKLIALLGQRGWGSGAQGAPLDPERGPAAAGFLPGHCLLPG